MINLEQLYKFFGRTVAVNGVSLHVRKQEIFGLVGPDGAGKTTLLRMICGLISPDRGRLSLMGQTAQDLEQVKDHLGYMPQRFSLYGDLTVVENLDFFGAMYKLDNRTIRERAAAMLALTGLAGFEGRLADHLSGGMKQKLALTCALITRPGILILDEPTYGVDPEIRKEFWKILYRLNREGMTVVVATPYMDEAELCHRVAFINRGRLIATDSPVSLKRGFPHRLLEVCAPSRDPDLFEGLDVILDATFYGDKYHLVVTEPAAAAPVITNRLAARGIAGATLREISPTMEDVYVLLTEKEVY